MAAPFPQFAAPSEDHGDGSASLKASAMEVLSGGEKWRGQGGRWWRPGKGKRGRARVGGVVVGIKRKRGRREGAGGLDCGGHGGHGRL